jgi:hypothetical protein
MLFYAYIEASEVEDANSTLEAEGYGPGNFSVPVSDDGTEPATGYMLSWGNAPKLNNILNSSSLRTFPDNQGSTFEDAMQKLGVKRIEPDSIV